MDEGLQSLTARLETSHWWFRARRRILTSLAERLLPGDGVVVDVGCGRGFVLAALPDRWERIGVDPSPHAIEVARRRHPELELRRGSAPAGVEDALRRADLVLILDVLEHVTADRELIGTIVDGLRSGAQLVVTVPADGRLWGHHDVRHGHVRRYEREDVLRLGESLPLRLRLLSPLNWRLYPIARIVRGVGRWIGRPAGPGGTDLWLPPAPLNGALQRIFEGEGAAVLAALDAPSRAPRRRGVSWLGVWELT